MDKSHLNGLVALFALLFSPLCTLGALPERTELFTRTYNGTYNVTSTVESVITGVGRVNLLICVPYPESNRYQDIVWQKAIPANLISYYSETGRPFIKFAKHERDLGKIRIERDFVATLYKVKFDWTAVTELYPYDTDDEEYKIYTRRYPVDGDRYEEAYNWILEQKDAIRAQCGSDDLEYIKSAYRTITTNFTYGSSSSFSDSIINKTGDCGYISLALCNLLRAGGIPARTMVCIRPDSGSHVWIEFYLQNYGWIPADATFDLERSDNFEWFGENRDNCIVMTYDTGFSVETANGSIMENVFVQWVAWWYFWWWEGGADETSRSVNTTMTFGSRAGKLDSAGKFFATDDMFDEWTTNNEHSVFTFDASANNSCNGGFTIYNWGWCAFEPSPLGSAIRLDSNDGPWTIDNLNLPEDFTILSIVRSVEQNNASLFCLGSSFHDQCGFALASGGKDIITLSYWENGTPHADLISANVPLSSEKYHAYAIRAKGKTVELFVDGVKAGTARLNAIPQYGLQFMGVIGGSNNTGLGMPVGARIDDWRFCNSAISDASIEAYANILAKYDEYPAFVRVEKFYVPYYWLHRHYPSSTNYDALAGQASASSTAIWKCFAAGTTPTDPADIFKAMIEFKDNAPYITWTPNLNTNGVKRKYTIWGATNLVDNVWHSPTNSSDCLFKVTVDMP